MTHFEEFQKLNKDHFDASLKSFGAVSKTAQAIAVEVADYSKKSFEDGRVALDKLLSAKTLEKAIEVQAEYVKGSYEGFVGQAAKLSELYLHFAKEASKPFEGYLGKLTPAK